MTPSLVPPVVDLEPMRPPVTVVGDVHLSEDDPGLTARFEAFLDDLPPGGTLVLLGDVFDWWVGRAQARLPFARRVLERLASVAARGTRLAFVAGNRDYAFDGADELAIEVWPDVVRTRWGDQTIVLSHGDLLCTADVSYLRMRRGLRSAPARWLLGALPLTVTMRLARGLRSVSTAEVERKSASALGIDYGAARRWLEAYEADALVLGHVHTGVHHRLPGARARDVYVLRDWHACANAVTFDERGIRLTST